MMFGLMGLEAAAVQTQPELEVIHRPPDSGRRRNLPPLLFVHGAYAGAWCWDEHFLPWFAGQGFDSYAVSLRGHGGSEGHERLHYFGIRDYVADLRHVITRHFEREPVVVGHSMGGMVVQKYLEAHTLPAVVLMAPVPSTGLGPSLLRMMATDPLLVTQIGMLQAGSADLVDSRSAARAVFSDDLDPALQQRYSERMQPESQRALLDMSVLDLPRRWRMQVPRMLVQGAGRDALFSAHEVQRTARTYGADLQLFPDTAHAMMLERNWTAVARGLRDWLWKLAEN